jgi:hypothetical protein
MSSVAQPQAGVDQTDLPYIVRAAVKLGVLECVFVLAIGMVSKYLDGPIETGLLAVLLTMGILAVILLPGIWTRPRTIEGIAGAAGIGLAATLVFLVVDVALFQPIGLWTNRWREIGGGSNWWYHPVWWMVGTFMPWMGAWILANQQTKSGSVSAGAALGSALACAVALAVVAVVVHFPGAQWSLPTFGVAFLPGLALATLISGLGAKRA